MLNKLDLVETTHGVDTQFRLLAPVASMTRWLPVCVAKKRSKMVVLITKLRKVLGHCLILY
jgi:hypothetical protein